MNTSKTKTMTNLSIEDSKAMYRLYLAVLEVDVDAVIKEYNKVMNEEIDDKSLGCYLAKEMIEIMPILSNESRNSLMEAWYQKSAAVVYETLQDLFQDEEE